MLALLFRCKIKNPAQGGVFRFSQALCLRKADVNCVRAFATLFHFKRDIVVITDLVFQTGNVNENFLLGTFFNDESKAFGVVEEFYFTIFH